MHDRLDNFVRMCKYNSFETYPIVHSSEVHGQSTETTPALDNDKTHEDDIVKNTAPINEQQYIYDKLFKEDGKEPLMDAKDMITSPMKRSSKARSASQAVKQSQEDLTSKDTENETETSDSQTKKSSKQRTSSGMRITSTDDDIKEEFPFYQSPTTSPGKDESVLGIRSIQKADDVEDIPLADRHVSLNKEKTKVIKRRIKKVKNKEGEKASKNKKGKDKTKSV